MQMKTLPAPGRRRARRDPRVQLLLADDDARLRTLLAARAGEAVDELVVLEAEDGLEAIRIARDRSPQIALLDVSMPHPGGIDVAITLRRLRPDMRLALRSADPLPYRDRARACRLPLFDKLQLDAVLDWLELQAQTCAEPRPLGQTHSFECSACGYGIVCSVTPERCPMCGREGTWIHSPWRPFTAGHGLAP
jgi:CheY-like chemotaxis protein